MSTNADEGTVKAIDERPPHGPTRGGPASGEVALKPDARSSDSENGHWARRPCIAITKRGVACGRTVGTRDYGEGPRCPAHRPKLRAPPPLAKPYLRAPVKALASLADALALASWAAIKAAEGKISANHANAISSLCREFRMGFADNGILERA